MKLYCKRGHLLNSKTSYRREGRKTVICRTCRSENMKVARVQLKMLHQRQEIAYASAMKGLEGV